MNWFCTGLYQRYITQSGSSLSSWAFRPQPEYATHSQKVGEYYNCTTGGSSKLMTCLRELTVPQLLNTTSLFGSFQSLLPYVWGPTSEPDGPDAILINTPKNILKKTKPNNHNWMTGIVRDEGLLITSGKTLDCQVYVSDILFFVFSAFFCTFMSKFQLSLRMTLCTSKSLKTSMNSWNFFCFMIWAHKKLLQSLRR